MTSSDRHSPTELRSDDPGVLAMVIAVYQGDVAEVRDVLARHPEVATARIVDDETGRGILHNLVANHERHTPNGAEIARLLIDGGADVHARFSGPHTETPLHWAASCNDVEVLDVLLDAGADIDAPGAVVDGGPPLSDAAAFGQWDAARRLVERGATTELWHEASLGIDEAVRARYRGPDTPDEQATTEALWCACHGGHLTTARFLHVHGGDPHWVGWDDLTPLGIAERAGATDVAAWLRSLG